MSFSLFSRPKSLIGLDIGSGAIKLVQLSKKKVGDGYILKHFGVRTLESELIVDGTIMDAEQVVSVVRELIEEQSIQETDVAFSVSGHSVIVKRIQLPLMSEDELDESINWEAEQYIPFDINDVNIDFHILDATDDEPRDQMDVLLVAVKKEKLTEYTGVVTEAGLNPVIVDVDAFTLENMFAVNYEIMDGEIVALVDIGASVMNINVIKGGAFAFTRDISIGGNRYTETIQRECNVSFEQAEQAKRGESVEGVDPEMLSSIINLMNDKIVSEVVRSFDYFKTTSNNEDISRILISGGGAKIPNLAARLEEKSGFPVEMVNPFKNIEIPEGLYDIDFIKEMAPLASVGVGLALREVGDR